MLLSFLPRIQIIFCKRFKHLWQVHQHLWHMNCRNKDSSHPCAGRGVAETSREALSTCLGHLPACASLRRCLPSSHSLWVGHFWPSACGQLSLWPPAPPPRHFSPRCLLSIWLPLPTFSPPSPLVAIITQWSPRAPGSAFSSLSPHSLGLHTCPHVLILNVQTFHLSPLLFKWQSCVPSTLNPTFWVPLPRRFKHSGISNTWPEVRLSLLPQTHFSFCTLTQWWGCHLPPQQKSGRSLNQLPSPVSDVS